MGQLKVGRYIVTTTNEETILFPKNKIKKIELIDYYYDIADIMVPYMKDRPITMVRYPNGINKEGFYQKDMPTYFPDWIKGKTVKKKEGGSTTYVVCNNNATLVYLANQACITPHLWLSKIDKLKYPDKLIFDIDPPPPGKNFSLVREIALRLKDILEDIGLIPFVKTTGSKGLHVVVPITRTVQFKIVRDISQSIAQILVDDDPKHLTLEVRKDKRRGRVFIDTLRNAFGQTAVAPYAVRPKEKAPIATPISWDEVEDSKLTSQRYNINNIFKYLEKHGDQWKNMSKSAKGIKTAQKKLKHYSKVILFLLLGNQLFAMEENFSQSVRKESSKEKITSPADESMTINLNPLNKPINELLKDSFAANLLSNDLFRQEFQDLLTSNDHLIYYNLLPHSKKLIGAQSIRCQLCTEKAETAHIKVLFQKPIIIIDDKFSIYANDEKTVLAIQHLNNKDIIGHLLIFHIKNGWCELCPDPGSICPEKDAQHHATQHYCDMLDGDHSRLEPAYRSPT